VSEIVEQIENYDLTEPLLEKKENPKDSKRMKLSQLYSSFKDQKDSKLVSGN